MHFMAVLLPYMSSTQAATVLREAKTVPAAPIARICGGIPGAIGRCGRAYYRNKRRYYAAKMREA